MSVNTFIIICLGIWSVALSDCMEETTGLSGFTSKWTDGGYTWDLSVSQSMGTNITGNDTQYQYVFSRIYPCSNYVKCSNNMAMAMK